MHRLDAKDNVPRWEKEGTWYREHSIVLSPQDLEGAQRLSFHYADDTADQKAWAYDPQSRRTRSIAVNLNETSFGLNFLIEDHSGFNGHVRDQVLIRYYFVNGGAQISPSITRERSRHDPSSPLPSPACGAATWAESNPAGSPWGAPTAGANSDAGERSCRTPERRRPGGVTGRGPCRSSDFCAPAGPGAGAGSD